MGREIKFRVFDEEEGMRIVEKRNYLGFTGLTDPFVNHENAVWMQFTGIKDKFGEGGGEMKNIDLENQNNHLIIAAMVNMIENEEITVEEVYQRIEDIKTNIHFALKEAEQHKKTPNQ